MRVFSNATRLVVMVFLLVFFAFSAIAMPVNEVLATVSVSSGQSVPQGGFFLAHFDTSKPLPANTKAFLSQKAYPLFQVMPGQYEALIGLNVDQKPGGYTLALRTAVGAAVLSEPLIIEVLPKSYGRQNIVVSGKTSGLKPIPGELETIGQLKTTVSPTRYWAAGRFVSPTVDCQNSPFGVRRYHNGKYIGDYHKGVDLRSPAGRDIRSTAGGVVKIATTAYRLHGGTVGVDHGQGMSSIYIHLSRVLVKPGQQVAAGDVIGKVGSTGFATGPHLHWGLYVTGEPVNPNSWVPYALCN